MTAYETLQTKFGAELEFHPFFNIEPLSSREFREQRINLADYTAIVFSSRHAIDAYFKLCDELRVKVPETMKYFCTTELVAKYLQKHIVYRKRKIFFGDGTPNSVIALVGPKHKGEKFLITKSENSADVLTSLFTEAKLDYSEAILVKSVTQDLKGINFADYEAVVLYNPSDVKALYENFPDFQQGDIKFITYGRSVIRAFNEHGLVSEIQAPTPEAPSAARAIEIYLENKK